MNIIKRFWSKVDKREPDECWEWLAGYGANGRGKFGLHYKMEEAHRISWAIAHRTWPIPKDKQINHTCDNRACVNPTHLYLGTSTDNNQDRSPLEPEDVKLIRWLYKSGDNTYEHIGRMFDVSEGCIAKICRGKRWSNIT